jgi:hypothetical protein
LDGSQLQSNDFELRHRGSVYHQQSPNPHHTILLANLAAFPAAFSEWLGCLQSYQVQGLQRQEMVICFVMLLS